MDVLDKFFKKFSYKFPKGYPDINDAQDMLMLEGILKEMGVNLNEADTGAATLFEAALVQAWYNVNKLTPPEGAIDPKEIKKLTQNPQMVKKAEAIIQDLNLSGGNSAQGTGRGLETSITPFWSKFGAKNKTPKTDIILGDKKISVKVGPSQLMSGGKSESLATFYAAMEDTPELLDSAEAQDVINTFDKFVESGITKMGTVDQNLKQGEDSIIIDGDKAHKEMRNKLQTLFNKSEKFKVAFVKEAMSGYKKFGANNAASADWILSADPSLSEASIHSVNDNSYASKIADQMNLTVRFKSSSTKRADLKSPENPKGKTGKYRFWSVVSLIFNPLKNLQENLLNKTKNLLNTGIKYLTKFISPSGEDIDIEFNNKIDFT